MTELGPSQSRVFKNIVRMHSLLGARKLFVVVSPAGHGKTILARHLANYATGSYFRCSDKEYLQTIGGRAGLRYLTWHDIDEWWKKTDRQHRSRILCFDNFDLLLRVCSSGGDSNFFADTKTSMYGNSSVFFITGDDGVEKWLTGRWPAAKLFRLPFTEADLQHYAHALQRMPRPVVSGHAL